MRRRTLLTGAALSAVTGPFPAGAFAAFGHIDRGPPHVAGFRLPARPRPDGGRRRGGVGR
ncbi:hypothetical protein DIZ27_13885 [Streptomyces sp. NWU339]|uniref:hypothetical protein n=1 Tax=Streptomyces sp. NWU339 TaxID=2185284 RepID=UPI000D672187|nr:hypothetical protein [Streptomyces sp. NWU339]PWI10156.1 hypothetical protein DIZ27_13885 [Streptomyces sp. NWU339]